MVFEVNAHLIEPDAVEMVVYNARGHVIYDQTTNNAEVAQNQYAAVSAQIDNPFLICHGLGNPPNPNTYVLRFLWLGMLPSGTWMTAPPAVLAG